MGDGSKASGPNAAFLWTQDGGVRVLADVLTNDYGLNLSGWVLTQATGISADGDTIVDTGVDPSGLTEGWVATIPEPATGLLVMAGVLGLAITRRERA